MEALRLGAKPPAPTDPGGRVRAALPIAARHDPDVFRAMLELLGCLSPAGEVLARPGLAERILELAHEDDAPPPPGPDRHALLRLAA